MSPIVSTSLSETFAATMKGMGALCFWEMADTKVTPDNLRAILAGEGLQINVPDIEPEGAIRRAARNWSAGRATDKYRADPVEIGDPTKIKICILHRQEDGAGGRKSARWETIESVVFDLTTRTWTSSASTPEVIGFIGLADDYMANLDHNWIRPNVIQKRLQEMRAFSLKSSSGLWYVTESQLEELAGLQRVVAAIGRSAMFVIHVGDTSQSQGAIQQAARSALTESLSELEARMEVWMESTRKIRSDAIETTLSEFAELIQRADLYQGALQIRMEDLTERIAAARAQASAIIDGNLGLHADQEAKPLGRKAMALLEVIQGAFPEGVFTLKQLEELLDGNGATIQAHLRDICRVGRLHKRGRDSSGSLVYALGAAPVGAIEVGGDEPETALAG